MKRRKGKPGKENRISWLKRVYLSNSLLFNEGKQSLENFINLREKIFREIADIVGSARKAWKILLEWDEEIKKKL